MTKKEVARKLKTTESRVRDLAKKLNLDKVGVGHVKKYSDLEFVRLKAGEKFKDYIFIQDIERFWIFYGFSGDKEIKIEI